MEKTTYYIKKIIAFLIITSLTILSAQLPVFLVDNTLNALTYFLIAVPLGLLFFAFVYFQFTGEKPPYLFELKDSNSFMQKKNGFWIFLKPFLMAVGFVYDIVIWLAWSVYQIFILFVDTVSLIKTILFWIVWGILWFLKLFVPPIVLLYKFFIYYVLKWPWWLYRICYLNVKHAFNRNFYFVSVWGAVIGAFLICAFYYIQIITGVKGIGNIGFVLSIIPFSWSVGEIASIKRNNLEKKPYWEVKRNFKNGFEAVRVILNYILTFLVLFLIQGLLDWAGWIPLAGFTFLGIFITINTAISFLLIVTLFILAYSVLIIPNFSLFSVSNNFNLEGTLQHLSTIFRRILRFSFVHIPASIFNVFILVIPITLLILSVALTVQIKNSIIDLRINAIDTRTNLTGELGEYKLTKKIEALNNYKNLSPLSIFKEIKNIDSQKKQIKIKTNQKGAKNEERYKLQKKLHDELDEIADEKKNAKSVADSTERENQLDMILEYEELLKEDIAKKEGALNIDIRRLSYDIEYLTSYKNQLPIVFFFICIWWAIFGGLVFAFVLAFYGNIAYDLYSFNEDGTPTYWIKQVRFENSKNRNQPLLGFTLLVILILAIVFFNQVNTFIQQFIPYFKIS